MSETREMPPDANLSEEESQDAIRRYLFRRFWSSGLGFWRTRAAWYLTGGLVAVIVLNLFVQYGLNVWNRKFFDALQNRDTTTAFSQGMLFPLLAIASVILAVLAVYLRMTTQRSWRKWLTSKVIDYWLANGRYFQLNLIKGDHGNPEYRIAEDLRVGTDAPVDFAAGLSSTFGWGSFNNVGSSDGDSTLIDRYRSADGAGVRHTVLYVDSGGDNGGGCIDADGDGINDDDGEADDNFCETKQMFDVLIEAGYTPDNNVFYVYDAGPGGNGDAEHNELAWGFRAANNVLPLFGSLF